MSIESDFQAVIYAGYQKDPKDFTAKDREVLERWVNRELKHGRNINIHPSWIACLFATLARLTQELEEERRKNQHLSSGWTCPKCGRVNAIWVSQCPICQPKIESTITTGKWTTSPQLPKDGE